MLPTPSEAEFAVLLRQAGLALAADQVARLHGVFGAVAAMQASIRMPAGSETACAEPMTTFAAEPPQ